MAVLAPGKDGSYIKFDENAFVVISKNKAWVPWMAVAWILGRSAGGR